MGRLLGLAVKRRSFRRLSPGDVALKRFTAYGVVPVWLAAGFLDYVWHRRTRIESTSGIQESLMHTLMMFEAAPAVLSPLLLEVNAGVLTEMAFFAVAHELTVLWDLWFTSPRRTIPAGEQVIHTFLEAPPFVVTAVAIATHWEQFLSLLRRGRTRAHFDLRLQRPSLSTASMVRLVLAMALFGALPHADELRRCFQAVKAGRVGQDTHPCLPEVFS